MHPQKILIPVVLFVLLLPTTLAAEMRPVLKIRAGVPPYQILGEVFGANNRQAARPPAVQKTEQAPDLTWLTDCSPAIRRSLIASPGLRLFTVRNLGPQLVSSLAAVDYGIRYLRTPVLLITGDTGNETIRLYMKGYRHLEPEIRNELDHLHLALTPVRRATGKNFRQQWLTNIERNVDYQVQQALDRYHNRVADGRLVVAGTILDLDNAYGRGRNRLLLINLNGETDPRKILRSPNLARFTKEDRELSVGRQRRGKTGE